MPCKITPSLLILEKFSSGPDGVLAAFNSVSQTAPVSAPDLNALKRGDADAWDTTFKWLWPTAFAVAKLKLQPYLPEDVEDVAIEGLEELVERVKSATSVEELKPLTASIVHNKAVSLLREQFAAKRGVKLRESLEAKQELEEREFEPAGDTCLLGELGQMELASLLRELQQELKPEQRDILRDFHLHRLTYEQIASKHAIAIGTVGVYLRRAHDALKRTAERQPKLLKELEGFLR